MPGKWNPSKPPTRGGIYFNFMAALQTAISGGSVGVGATIGTADWGPVGHVEEINSAALLELLYSGSQNGTLRESVLSMLEGFDGGGATRVLSMRIAGTAAKAGKVVLKDSSAGVALKLTAKYPGARANNFTVVVQTNAVKSENKDLILFESGVELERWENVKEGLNNNFVTAINELFPSEYVTAAIEGSSARALVNIVGVISGAGGFVEGNSGLTTALEDTTNALATMQNQAFETIALADNTDKPTMDAFVAWLKERNEAGIRTFGVIGGAAAETLTEAKERLAAGSVPPASGTGYSDGKNTNGEYTYHNVAVDLINVGATDLRRLSDNAVFSTAQIASKIAGVVARVGITRSIFNIRLTGYQVNNPLTPANYEKAGESGVVVFANTTTTQIAIDNGNTALLTTDEDERPVELKDIRNSAICHFIENTLTEVSGASYLGTLLNNKTGRNTLKGAFLKFLQALEVSGALESGTSSVEFDERFVQVGDGVYLRYGIAFQGIVKRIFNSVALSGG
jgi:hypothetical protein